MSTIQLNPNALKWVEALESGEYEQGRECLTKKEHGHVRHCCLGVACLIANQNGVPLAIENDYGVVSYNKQAAVLPPEVCEWLGLRTTNGSCVVGGEIEELTAMNDQGSTFAELAAIIRSQPRGLFKS